MNNAVKYKLVACYVTLRNDVETWHIPNLGMSFSGTERNDAFTKMKVATPTLNGGRWITTKSGVRVFIRSGFISLGVRKERKASARGANKLTVQDFKAGKTDKWEVARHHVRKHTGKGTDYPNEEMYLGRAIELAQKPVGGNIIGYARKDGKSFVRYDKSTNEYVVAVVGSEGGIVTLYQPTDGIKYYYENKEDDLGEQKRIKQRARQRRNRK